eukprot:TRINITY_DN6532_c0_g1_i2.p1 TRINITY_DN6532_c0_g1~~TRINITY_DN6532_c0_g1_i2.p1  ORF type:complete len:201 (+),score=50.73 TRINITY_DN6532_c0_g1_i2:145-747(+)
MSFYFHLATRRINVERGSTISIGKAPTSSNLYRKLIQTSHLNKSISQNRISFSRFFSNRIEWNNAAQSYKEGSISISDRCVEKFNKMVSQDWVKDKEDAALRLEIKQGGCSGFEYSFSLDHPTLPDNQEQTNEEEEDVVDRYFQKDGCRIVVDSISLTHVNGSLIDYDDDNMIKSAFVVAENPNATISCSCGTSFASKNS